MNSAGIELYVEIGAGIESMVQFLNPLVNLGFNSQSKSYLELGCGFGFLTDYAKFMGFGESLGVEDAGYGKLGSEILDFPCQSLSEFQENPRTFDVILASEVIEHVADPLDFLVSIKNRLNADGIVVITTPNSEFIKSVNVESNDSQTLAALSPGNHTCLFSPNALKNLFIKVGFKSIEIIERNERLIVYASDKLEYNLILETSQVDKENYLRYLEHLTMSSNESVRVGANFRIFKELVNQGVLDTRIQNAYNFLSSKLSSAILDLGVSESSSSQRMLTLDDYREVFTFYEGVFLFYAAQYERNLGKPGVQIALLEKAISIIDRELFNFPQFFQESSSVKLVALKRLEEALTFMNLRYINAPQPNESSWFKSFSSLLGMRRI